MSISKASMLQRASDLTLSIRGDEIHLELKGKRFPTQEQALSVLEIFSRPKSLEQGLAELQRSARSAEGYIRRANLVMNLIDSGALQFPTDEPERLGSHPGHFSSPNVHIRMLNDTARTLAFQKALKAVVRPDDVVLDIGTGTGILAALAARAGARKVYAVERSTNFPKLARRFFADNGLADRVTVIEGDSTQIELPERADVLVSEIIGNDPLDEGVLSTYTDARKRLLKPDARLIPSALHVFAIPFELPASIQHRSVIDQELIEQWRASYGLDFTVYAEDAAARQFSTLINAHQLKAHKALSDPITLARIDLNRHSSALMNAEQVFTIRKEGQLNAVALLFDLTMARGQEFSIHPSRATPTNSWFSRVYLPGTPIAVRAGQQFRIGCRHTGSGSSIVEIARVGS